MAAWLPIITALIGVVATVIGWLLGQLGQLFALRRDRRKAMARAVYGMLQVREQIRRVPEAIRLLSEKLQIPAAQQVVLVAVLENFLVVEDSFAREFEESMAVLAESDPVLAARMRGRNQAVPLLRRLRQMIAANPAAAALWNTMECEIMKHALPRFDDAILEIGYLHGRRIVRDIKADMAKKADVPEEVLTTIATAIKQQIQVDQALTAQLAQQQKSKQPSQNLNRTSLLRVSPQLHTRLHS
jgi:hypothetical protein